MNTTRRDMLIASLGAGVGAAALAVLPGCQTEPMGPEKVTNRPGPDLWGAGRRPTVAVGPAAPTYPPPPTHPPAPPAPTKPEEPLTPPPPEPGTVAIAGIDILPRSAWTRVLGPISDKHDPMNGVKYITVHHEGWTPVNFEDKANTIDRLEKIRGAHSRSKRDGGRGWSDIGYHFVIDRAGRIWEARNLKFQGAHVDSCNPNNLGIMCLGNFDEQMPSQAQTDALTKAIKAFKDAFKVQQGHIYTHQEWFRMGLTHSTDCPGRNLQAQMVKIRKAM